MKISARNILKGTVKKITPGAVNTEVVVELPGGAGVPAGGPLRRRRGRLGGLAAGIQSKVCITG